MALAPITESRAVHLVVPLTKPHSEREDDGEGLVEELGGGVALNADGVHARAGGLQLGEEVFELVVGVVARGAGRDERGGEVRVLGGEQVADL